MINNTGGTVHDRCFKSRMRILLLTVVALNGVMTTVVQGQESQNGVVIGAAFGGATLDGSRDGGVPPAGATLLSALRISVGRPVGAVRLSFETEINWTGAVDGKRLTTDSSSGLVTQFYERRRDALWSLLGGVQLWEPHRIASVHIVGGMSYVKPFVNTTSQTYSLATSSWTDTTPIASSYTHAWALSGGADFLFTFEDVAVGPTFRWHGYLQNPAPFESGPPTHAISIGLTAAYHF
jgi:hypothetical protein